MDTSKREKREEDGGGWRRERMEKRGWRREDGEERMEEDGEERMEDGGG